MMGQRTRLQPPLKCSDVPTLETAAREANKADHKDRSIVNL